MSKNAKTGTRTRAGKRGRRAQTLGERIIQGLNEAIAFERGELGAKVTRREIPESGLGVAESGRFQGARVARLRERLRVSQPVFAQVLNVSAETVKKWEQGTRVPDGAAVRLLEIAEEHPEWLIERLGAANGKQRRER